MSDRSSATQPSESDFHDSHPIDDTSDNKTTPSIGDLTSIESSEDSSESQQHSIGDITDINNGPQSEILGDISLLDEAFAELDEDDAQNDTDIPVLNESIEAPSESRIVPLDSSAASVPLLEQEATVFAEMLKPNSTVESTASPASSITSEIINEDKEDSEPTEDDGPLFDSVDALNNSNISEMNSDLEMAADLISSTVPTEALSDNIEDTTSKNTTVIENNESDSPESSLDSQSDAALDALLASDTSVPELNDPDVESDISDLQLDITSELPSETSVSNSLTSIDEKIAMASGNGETSINEVPISSLSQTTEFSASFAEGLIGSQPSTYFESESVETEAFESETEKSEEVKIETIDSESYGEDNIDEFDESIPELPTDNLVTDNSATDSLAELNGTEISEFNPEIDLNSEPLSHATLSVGITGQDPTNQEQTDQSKNNLNLNIPFELHSQLSQKIDELVIEATSSITEELHAQLTSRLDLLLGSAVETVLPKLVNQMATELRSEVNNQVKQQLPTIINEVLNKTRLHK